ncbi:DUF7507 domain-containing protein, partial [Flavobacterium sp.]|uniref:DUF7507 domain-containing protein n=1 Tax=Flavobacterium sp. TaxID=239 RepID=UPI003B9BDA9E
ADATCISAGTSVTINAQPVAPVMSFNKTATILGPVVAGTIIQYNFEIQNLGTTTVSDLVISDPTIQVPSLLVADVPAGGVSNVSHNYIITQADIDSGLITNSATLSGVGVCGSFSLVSNDPSTPITDDPTITILTPAPTMTLVKTSVLNTTVVGDPAVANVGDTIQYSFVVTNTGNVTLSNVVINDDTLSATPFTVGTLAVGASVTITTPDVPLYILTQSDLDAGQATNTATATGTTPGGGTTTDVSDDGITENGNDNPTVTPLTPAPSMTLVKTSVLNTTVVGDPAVANVGDTIQYSFVVTNTGNVTLSNVV